MNILPSNLGCSVGDSQHQPEGILQVESEWREDRETAPRDDLPTNVFERQLGAIAGLSFDQGSSVYVLEGDFEYAVHANGLTIRRYAGHGMSIEGLDRGPVEYSVQGEPSGALDADRQFEIACELRWSDAYNEGRLLQLALKGTMLEDGRIAYLNSRISGQVSTGDVAQTRVLVDVPALM